jgi:hypothetical protein
MNVPHCYIIFTLPALLLFILYFRNIAHADANVCSIESMYIVSM